MTVIFAIALIFFYWAVLARRSGADRLGVDTSLGNMEGQDVRFRQAGAGLFVDAATGAGTGASNAVLESMSPIAGLIAMFNLMLGCISPVASTACSRSCSLPRSCRAGDRPNGVRTYGVEPENPPMPVPPAGSIGQGTDHRH
jgi:hypothetical protein